MLQEYVFALFGIFPDKLGKGQQEKLLLSKSHSFGFGTHYGFVQLFQGQKQIAVTDKIFRKSDRSAVSCKSGGKLLNNIGFDVERPVGKSIAVKTAAEVIFAGVEQQNVSRFGSKFFPEYRKASSAALNKTDHIIFVEMRRKWLGDTMEKAGFKLQVFVKDNFSVFLLHR